MCARLLEHPCYDGNHPWGHRSRSRSRGNHRSRSRSRGNHRSNHRSRGKSLALVDKGLKSRNGLLCLKEDLVAAIQNGDGRP